MANHKSAKKRARQTLKRTERNRHTRSRVKSAVKSARTALDAGDAGDAGETASAIKLAEGVLRRAASKGAIPKKRASRQVSRLAKSQNRLAST